MTVFFDKRRRRWRYDFQFGRERHARECVDEAGNPVTSRRAALNCENAARALAKIGPKLPRAGDLALGQVINDLSERWMAEPDWPNKQRYAREIIAYFGAEKPMRDIDGAQIDDFISHLLRQKVMIWAGGSTRNRDAKDANEWWRAAPDGRTRSPSTVNRYLPLLRMAFARAYNTRDPLTRERAIEEIPVIKDLDEPKRRARPTPDSVITDLYDMLPEYVIEAIRGTLYFGLRRGEIFNLQIKHADFDARGIWLANEDVKDNEDAFLPGSRDAMQFLAQLVDQARERGTKFLITRRRYRKDPEVQAREPWKEIQNPKTTWRNAMDKIEEKFGRRWRWHDLRATFITNVAVNAGPMAAQKLARHSDFSTTQAYIDVADEVTRDAVEMTSQRPALRAVKGGKT
jgi:integrase